ncbi:MAG: hypothetical protein J5I47_11155 [Vicingus serpentipes]|nr:hypothetical protein [Vicingus serpentipes]
MKKLFILCFIFPGLLTANNINTEDIAKSVINSIKNKKVSEKITGYYANTDQVKSFIKNNEYFYIPDEFDVKNPIKSGNTMLMKSVQELYDQNPSINFSEATYLSSDADEEFQETRSMKLNIWLEINNDAYLLQVYGIHFHEKEWLILPGLSVQLFESLDDKTTCARQLWKMLKENDQELFNSKILTGESYSLIDERLLKSFQQFSEYIKNSGGDPTPYRKTQYEDLLPSSNFDSLTQHLNKSKEAFYQQLKNENLPINHLRYYKTMGHSYNGSGTGDGKLGYYSSLTFSVMDSNNNIYTIQIRGIYAFDNKLVLTGDMVWEGFQEKRYTSRIALGNGTMASPYIIDNEGIFIIPENPITTAINYFIVKGVDQNSQVVLEHQFDYDGNEYDDPEFSNSVGVFFSSSSYYSGPEESTLFEYSSSSTPKNYYLKMEKKIDKEGPESSYLPSIRFKVSKKNP